MKTYLVTARVEVQAQTADEAKAKIGQTLKLYPVKVRSVTAYEDVLIQERAA